MNPTFGDIYLVNCEPSFGREMKKVRPALVIQESKIGENSPYVTVMPISSKVDKLTAVDVYVPKDAKNNLIADSIIKVRQISSFDKKRLIHFIGKANSPTVRSVRGYLRKHFGL